MTFQSSITLTKKPVLPEMELLDKLTTRLCTLNYKSCFIKSRQVVSEDITFETIMGGMNEKTHDGFCF